MMEEAGMNVIRIAESTWRLGSQEGTFDFSHLRRMLDCAKEHNLSVIIGTQLAIPSWLAKEKDILAFTHDGQKSTVIAKIWILQIQHIKTCKNYIEKLMEQVKDEPNVIGFGLIMKQNTMTPVVHALKMFVDYLKEKWPDTRI